MITLRNSSFRQPSSSTLTCRWDKHQLIVSANSGPIWWYACGSKFVANPRLKEWEDITSPISLYSGKVSNVLPKHSSRIAMPKLSTTRSPGPWAKGREVCAFAWKCSPDKNGLSIKILLESVKLEKNKICLLSQEVWSHGLECNWYTDDARTSARRQLSERFKWPESRRFPSVFFSRVPHRFSLTFDPWDKEYRSFPLLSTWCHFCWTWRALNVSQRQSASCFVWVLGISIPENATLRSVDKGKLAEDDEEDEMTFLL